MLDRGDWSPLESVLGSGGGKWLAMFLWPIAMLVDSVVSMVLLGGTPAGLAMLLLACAIGRRSFGTWCLFAAVGTISLALVLASAIRGCVMMDVYERSGGFLRF